MVNDNAVEIPPAAPNTATSQSLVKEIAIVALTQGLVMVALFLNYWLIRRSWGMVDLGAYSLLMRMRGLLEWIVTLQLPIAIAREIAIRAESADGRPKGAVAWTGLALGFTLILTFSLAACMTPRLAARVIFGNAGMAEWVPPFAVLLVGYGSCLLASSVARGLMLFRMTCAIQVLYAAVAPTILLLAGRGYPLKSIVTASGLTALIIAGISLAIICSVRRTETGLKGAQFADFAAMARRLLNYGAPRLGTLLSTGVFTAAIPWVVSGRNMPALLVAVNAMLSLLSAVSAAMNPVGIVLLPHLSKLLGDGRVDQARAQMSQFIEFMLNVGPLLTLISLAALQPLIRVWLGPEVAGFSWLVVAFGFAVSGMLVLEMLRNPIDAASSRPWNAASYGTGATVLLTAYFVVQRLMRLELETAIAIGFAVGYISAAVVSLSIASRLYLVQVGDLIRSILPVFVGLSALCMAVRLYAGGPVVNAVTGFGAASLFTIFVVRRRPEWLSTARARLLPHMARG